MIKNTQLDPKIMGDIEVLSKKGWGVDKIAGELNDRYNTKFTGGNISVYTDVMHAEAMRNALRKKEEQKIAGGTAAKQKLELKEVVR
ncbi:MAG: hypothetical protein KGH61_00305 [Candidatus Micrarchaeota archaeon]|nr:hypothetical protein [Candidatus Micrarchaeota archaeon]MDE1847378.1 hypothetical protein [Candidatus Micrarchaeota archaeon]MDE1863993.1 hypothetical protein [Candidatus Micrarchaeota archaeon]